MTSLARPTIGGDPHAAKRPTSAQALQHPFFQVGLPVERGLPSGPRFDHTTGEGHVPFHKGDYHDALRHKNNQVALLLVECFGGIASGGARLLRYLARRASDKKRGRDGTKYSKFHPRGYLSHHLAAISMAAVYTDAAHIADGVIGLKQRSLAASDPTE